MVAKGGRGGKTERKGSKPGAKRTASGSQTVAFARARALALALPGVEEGTSYGTPAFRVGGKLLARLLDDGESLAVRVDFDVRDALLESRPQTFYLTDHYRGYPTVLVRLPVPSALLREVLDVAWRRTAPARLVRAADERA
jgi:hypothetical protein